MKRLIERIGKSKKPAIEHRGIWNESFSMFDTDAADEILKEVGQMLDGLTDSKQITAQNIEVEQWTNRLLRNDPTAEI